MMQRQMARCVSQTARAIHLTARFGKAYDHIGALQKTNGLPGRSRRYFEWDYTHCDIEVYNKRGDHLGSADPKSGVMYKPPVAGRKIKL